MTKYEIIYEALQEKVNSGELTVEDAEILNDIAYERYAKDMTEYTESCDDEGMTYDEYFESMEDELFGEATRLAKEIRKKNLNNQNKYGETYNILLKDSIDAQDRFIDDAHRKGDYRKADKSMITRDELSDIVDNYAKTKMYKYNPEDSLTKGKKIAKKQAISNDAIKKWNKTKKILKHKKNELYPKYQ